MKQTNNLEEVDRRLVDAQEKKWEEWGNDFNDTDYKIFLHQELSRVREETISCKGQHNFVLSQTINEPFGSGTGFKTFYYVICTKCGRIKKQELDKS